MSRRLLVDRRALAALTFPHLAARYPHHARLLLWLRACWLIRREQLHALGWPDPSTRQNRNQGLRRLTVAELVEPIDEQGRVYKLGRRGASVLQAYGLIAPYRTTPRSRAQPGLLIASEFAVALGLALMQHRHVLSMSWSEMPFAGAVVRPDASGMLRYSVRPGPECRRLDLLRPEPSWPPAAGEYTLRLFLEVDRATQFAEKIEERVRSWAAAFQTPAYAELPANTVQLVLWVTAGTWQRVHTIRQIWSEYTGQVAAFTTCYQLRGERDDGPMAPLQAVWSDRDGSGLYGSDLFALALNATVAS